MADNKHINNFALKWLGKYRDLNVAENELSEGFDDECFSLGFEMDCGKSFEDAFPNTNAFSDYTQLDRIIKQIDGINLLGSVIFSKWRYITHWSYEDLLSAENRQWFIIAFSRLVMLSSAVGNTPYLVVGQAKKIRIISSIISFGPSPRPADEVEQHLTITDEGRIKFSGYNFGGGNDEYKRGRSNQFHIDKEKVDNIFSAFTRFFSGEFEEVFCTDIGSWEMVITNTQGQDFPFRGSLCTNYEIDGINLSDMLRGALNIENLYVFDGDNKPDMVERISIDYHRVTKIKPNIPLNNNVDSLTWDYSEQLVIDRKTETIEHIQRIESGCVVTRKYQVQQGVSRFLDDLDADSLFEYIEGNPPDVVENPSETKEYSIRIDFKKSPYRVIAGTYDKNGLPTDWPEFADSIYNFMRFYGLGELFDPSVYEKVRRRADEYMFCSVEFNESGKSYYYISDDDTIEVGDFVLVPVGNDSHIATVEVIAIEYFSEENAPFPIEKAKHIISKYSDDDFGLIE